METPQLTETILIRVKEGVAIKNDTPEMKAFQKLTDIVKSQDGFLRQYWGHQVEDDNIFVWSIDWKWKSDHDRLLESVDLKSTITAGLAELSDVKKHPPFITYTEFKSDPTAAYTAPVTEVAFVNMPAGYGEAEKYSMDNDMSHVGDEVKTVGKSWGSATGWIVETLPKDTEPTGEMVALLGVFGYASIDDHMRWRETPEHARIMVQMGVLAEKTGMSGTKAKILGGRSMFHVHFEGGK
ncbi:hypothetical protein GLAREA_01861 [Glarea lozoyensis ATCC 20868]|uniref:ABM domain-containing protein n=1 Tax=Glarea lozoyensis (strain ATCC 20868 / MF5171) TaxID=1116229 RepID=S3CL47_GLAL2|nr:uncharacterized protein GLAREA_01861 [Glarea lozoyensis ATCC 20868]EPE25949.1 hypothetical protein GLAREA_01861 [Glarea lozoyensis ATCC 20868]